MLNLVLSKLLAYGLARLKERSTAAGAAALLLGVLHLTTTDQTMQSLVDVLAALFGFIAVIVKTTADGQSAFKSAQHDLGPIEPILPSPPGTTSDQLNKAEVERHGGSSA